MCDYSDYTDFIRLANVFKHPIAIKCPIECYEEYMEITENPYSHAWMIEYIHGTLKKFHKKSNIGRLIHMMKNALKSHNISYTDKTIGTFMAAFFEKELVGTDYEKITQFVVNLKN